MKKMVEEKNLENKKRKKDTEKKTPEREMVDAWIGYAVVSIVMTGLFAGMWWALIPQIILLISAIGKTIEYASNKKPVYIYSTIQEDLTGIWIAAIIVNIVMAALFRGAWWSNIPVAVLYIKALETTYYFYKTNQQKSAEKSEIVNVPLNLLVKQPLIVPMQTSSGVQEVVYVKPAPITMPASFCAMCGTKNIAASKFCAMCGNEF
jgi:hypothetical protein